MAEGSDDLERLSREQLILKARVLGVERAELMTRVELRDEIVRRSEPDLARQKRARGFLGVARDLVASVVEAGLNLPDAAKLIRGDGARESEWKGPPPVATVTLAEIYAAQGHLDRALGMLDEVLAKEPDHDPARALRDRLAAGTDPATASPKKRIKINFVEPPPESTDPDPDTDLPPEIPAPAHANVNAPVPVPAPVNVNVNVPVPVPDPPSSPSPPCVLTLSLSNLRQVYWEVPTGTWDALRARFPQGRAVLRVLSFRTRAGKVERHAQDLPADAEVGSAVLSGLRADAVVRAAVGWEADGRFVPFILASDLGSSPSATGRSGQFRPHPLVGGVAPNAERRALDHLSKHA